MISTIILSVNGRHIQENHLNCKDTKVKSNRMPVFKMKRVLEMVTKQYENT